MSIEADLQYAQGMCREAAWANGDHPQLVVSPDRYCWLHNLPGPRPDPIPAGAADRVDGVDVVIDYTLPGMDWHTTPAPAGMRP